MLLGGGSFALSIFSISRPDSGSILSWLEGNFSSYGSAAENKLDRVKQFLLRVKSTDSEEWKTITTNYIIITQKIISFRTYTRVISERIRKLEDGETMKNDST